MVQITHDNHVEVSESWFWRRSSTPIRAAEYFRPVHKLIGVKSVQKIETGLECDQRLLRKLKNTVTGAHCAMLLCEHSVSQFSRQPLTPFEPRFDFPDRLDPYKLMQRPKIFRAANRRRRFPRRVSSRHAVHEHSVSQFSRQPLTPFEPRFDFPDRLDPYQLMYRPKIFCRANRRLRFPRRVSSCNPAA